MWVHDLIGTQDEEDPAIVDIDGRVVSYGVLRGEVAALAKILAGQGVRAGDRVMVVSENCALFPALVMALSRLSAWVIPVNARQSAGELRATAAHSGARIMVMTGHASKAAADHAKAFHAREVACCGLGPVVVTRPVETNLEPVGDSPKTRIAALMYTTGTTSAPKGVMLSHHALVWNAHSSAWLRGIGAGEEVLGVLPGTHIFGFASAILGTFAGGAVIRMMARFDPAAVLNALADGVAVMPAVPQMYAALLTYLETSGRAFSAPKLHFISAGGAPLDPDWKMRIEKAFGLPLNNGFGMTEAAPTIAATRNWDPVGDTSVGTAVPGVDVSIREPDGEGVGELIVRSPALMTGYYRNPKDTAEALRDGALHTGDLARIDAAGNLHIAGRLKELIVRGGFNVYPPRSRPC